MRLLSFAIALAVSAGPLLAQEDALHVLHHEPSDTAAVSSVITVTFDRPVAGRLDATVEAVKLIRIEPAITGRAEWRDPITIRFIPDEPLVPGRSFTVTIDTAFSALDGSRLARPYRFSFRVPGARLLARSFGGDYADRPAVLPYDGRLRLLYSAPVDMAALQREIRLEFARCDADQRSRNDGFALKVVQQRPVEKDDPYSFSVAGGWQRDSTADRFRRVVEIEPVRQLPEGCAGTITLPTTADDSVHGRNERYAVRTSPPFVLSSFECGTRGYCNHDVITFSFSAAVKAADVKRYVHIEPAIAFTYNDGVERASAFTSPTHLAPRTTYTLVVDSALRDVDGRQITGVRSATLTTGDYLPTTGYAAGIVTIPRDGPQTIPLRHMNVAAVNVTTWFIPEANRTRALAGAETDPVRMVDSLAGHPTTTTVALNGTLNVAGTTELPLPKQLTDRRDGLVAVRVEIASETTRASGPAVSMPDGERLTGFVRGARPASPIAFLQRTSLAIHARVGRADASVTVTDIASGLPRAGASVRYLGPTGVVVAESRTDDVGVATLRLDSRADPPEKTFRGRYRSEFDVVEAVADGDRAALPVSSGPIDYWHRNPLEPSSMGGRREHPNALTATLFADRGIYRPGEMVYFKGVVRAGILGALKVPSGLRVRLRLIREPDGYDEREPTVVLDTVLAVSEFGTVSDSLRLAAAAPLGTYVAGMDAVIAGDTTTIAWEHLRVAEYRAPEFLVSATTDSTVHFAGDTARVAVTAKFLFGAPMGRAPVRWRAELHELKPWEIRIPGAQGWTVGEWDWLAAPDDDRVPNAQVGESLLDSTGRAELRIPLAALRASRPGRVEVSVAVTDVNAQMVTTGASVAIHPAHLYILARRATRGWYWPAGRPATVQVRTVTPEGEAVGGAVVIASVVRRHWTWTNGSVSVRDTTVRVDTIRTTADSTAYTFTPAGTGLYDIRLTATDGRGGIARTTLSGWAIEAGRRENDGPPYRLPLVASTSKASVGDDVEVAFESPFDAAEGWVTIERERVLESRRLRVHRGLNTIPVRITAAHVPNVFVSVMLLSPARGVGARPNAPSELMRVGYAEIAVGTEPKRLAVEVMPHDSLYAPGGQARVRVQVTDAAHRGARSEVALWAVDEGVLALTGYTTPDLIARLYRPRGLGEALWSTVPTFITVAPELGAFGSGTSIRIRGAMGYARLESQVVTAATEADGPSMRTQFRTTAFYLASAVTDDDGSVELSARVPDNLTTYRLMAVAVSPDDRFGSGDTTLLVTRPIVARPALPRFVRAADTLIAGAVVNARDGRARRVSVNAETEGMKIRGAHEATLMLAEGRGAPARFAFDVPGRDSARDTVVVRLRASDGKDGDAVETRLPVEPDFHPRVHAVIGSLRDRADVAIDLPADIDASRSLLTLRVGSSPLVPMLAAYEGLRDYPYDCTEQLASTGRALLAIWRATGDGASKALGSDPRARAQAIADKLVRRQRADGAFRYWDDHDWTSPWLTAWAGQFLVEARAQGIVVDKTVITRAAAWLDRQLALPLDTGGMNRTERREHRLGLGDRVAAVDFLRQAGEADVKAEDALLRVAGAMTWEDRLRLAEVLALRPDATPAARGLVDAAWRAVTRAGARVDLPDSAHTEREFPSRIAPAARLLSASLALRPDHQLLGGLVETVLQQGRAEREWAWNTQDYASVVMAMAALAPRGGRRGDVTVSAGSRNLISRPADAPGYPEQVPLEGLLVRAPNGGIRLPLRLASSAGAPVFYALSVTEVPSRAPVTPDIQGIVVERWYERFDDGQPVTSVKEGDLVRVRLRITVPADREFVAVEDPLPAGLEPIDLSLKTSGTLQPFVTPVSEHARRRRDPDAEGSSWQSWLYGRWEDGGWSPWEHKAMHDDKVVWFARMLWPGTYSAGYIARATIPGSFVRPPAHAEEMYNPALEGRSDGGRFTIEQAKQ